jgi:glycosyltransferase involved in cell wall biosynthesis
MELSVVIPCFNAASVLAPQLDAFAAERWDGEWELIVADNGSTDGSAELIQSYADRIPNLRVVDASARRGQPFALNTGVQHARGTSVALSDADDVIAPGWVKGMGQALRDYEFVACRIDTERLNEPWTRYSRGSPQRDGVMQYNYPKYLPHAGGGTIGFRRQLLLDLGGFDESLPCLHDTDLCWKLQLRGIQLHFVPDAVLQLRVRPTLGGIWKQAMSWGEYNVLIYKRYLPRGMPRLTWRDMAQGWANVVKFAWKHGRQLREKGPCAAFLWQLGWRVGRIRGSLKYRVIGF